MSFEGYRAITVLLEIIDSVDLAKQLSSFYSHYFIDNLVQQRILVMEVPNLTPVSILKLRVW